MVQINLTMMSTYGVMRRHLLLQTPIMSNYSNGNKSQLTKYQDVGPLTTCNKTFLGVDH